MSLLANNKLRESITSCYSSADYFNQLDEEWSSFNLKYRELTRGILPPHLPVDAGSAQGFTKL